MSGSSSGRLVPIWMFVVCWIPALPFLMDSELRMVYRVVLFVALGFLTIGLLRHRDPAGG